MSRATSRRWLSWRVSTLVVAAVLVASATIAMAVTPGVRAEVLGAAHPAASSSSTARGTPSASETVAPPSAGVIGPAPAASPGAPPSPSILAARIDAVPHDRIGTVAGRVVNLTTGTVLFDRSGARAMMPGSTLKLLTATAALDALGPWHRFVTRVVSPKPGTIILVGGGDPYLDAGTSTASPAPPSSATLASLTAAALLAKGTTTVTLGYDDSLFSGSSWNADWPSGYRSQVSPVSALWIDEGRDPVTSKFTKDPAATAARTFAAQLSHDGVTVRATPSRTVAPAGAATLAQVRSWPLGTIIEQTLRTSDNSAAEVLLRQVALASGQPPTFAGGVRALTQRLTRLGLPLAGATVVDGSGLSRNDRISPDLITAIIHLAATTPDLRPILDGMPVAGVSGTLATRFFVPSATAGRGLVHAKTGTLTHVSSEAGYVTDRGGRPARFRVHHQWRGPRHPDHGHERRHQRLEHAQLSRRGGQRAGGLWVLMSDDIPRVDWRVAASTGRRLVRPGPVLAPGERHRLVSDLRESARRAVALGEDAAGLASSDEPLELVVDRPGWIRANTQLAAGLLEPLVPAGEAVPLRGAVPAAALGAQIGGVLAVLAGRVLGQFDPFTPPGRLYLVAPTILEVERSMGVVPRDFRLWVCLHEQTHRLQFTAAPWLVGHLSGIVAELVLGDDDRGISEVLGDLVHRPMEFRARPLDDWFRSPGQRERFDRANAVMALLEGHADVMMDRAGTAAIPTLSVIRERFERRRGATMLASRIGRLLGLDRKLAQYREGAAFCAAVIDAVGVDGLNAVWTSAEYLPSPQEIGRPDEWVARVHG